MHEEVTSNVSVKWLALSFELGRSRIRISTQRTTVVTEATYCRILK